MSTAQIRVVESDASLDSDVGTPGTRRAPRLSPMQPVPGRLPQGPGWAYEFRYDGVRAIVHVEPDGVRVNSDGAEVTDSFPELQELATVLGGRRAVLDGEIVAFDEEGLPSPSRLQHRAQARTASPNLVDAVPVVFCAFDLLSLYGTDLTALPYVTRREALAAMYLNGEHVRMGAHFIDIDGVSVLQVAASAGLRGVVAKRLSARYRPGRRSKDWTSISVDRR